MLLPSQESHELAPKAMAHRQVLSPARKILSIVLIFLLLMAALGYLGGKFLVSTLMSPISAGLAPQVVLKIPPSVSTSQIAAMLRQNNLIRNEKMFIAYARYTGMDKQLKAGEYTLSSAMSISGIIAQLVKGGEIVTYPFTIPEGYTLKQMASALAAKGFVDEQRFLAATVQGNYEFPFLTGLPQGAERLQGFLFPDTYYVPRGMTESQIVKMMLDRFGEVYTTAYQEKVKAMGMSTLEVVTLASIIEREAKKEEERPIVSAVFHNRLKKQMRLESCATIQYLLGEPKEILTLDDLAIESPYNTYKYAGLPPGPIAAPGKASLQAALSPAPVDYLFFVVKPDGSHAFARTLAEHNSNKRKYLP